MILDEQGMQRARELAREIVRIEKKKEREQTRQAINELKNTIVGISNAFGTVFSGILGIGKAVDNAFKKGV